MKEKIYCNEVDCQGMPGCPCMKPEAWEKWKFNQMHDKHELSEISGESVQTLNNWHKNEPRRFELILKGALFEKTMSALDAATRP